MNTPKPPTIPSTGQFNILQVNQIFNNKGVTIDSSGSIVSNGYLTAKGSATIISGQNQSYSAAAIAGGMIIRTDVSFSPSNESFPTATELASELGLPDEDGRSYIRSFMIYNNSIRTLVMSNLNGWTLYGSNSIAGNRPGIFYYTLSYSSELGWNVICISDAEIVPF